MGEKSFKQGEWTSNWEREWRLRTNQELKELYKSPDMVADIISEGYGGWDM
jgi:hypothetical protein